MDNQDEKALDRMAESDVDRNVEEKRETEYGQFKAWLERNMAILKDRSIDDIADLANAAGFSIIVTSQWKTSLKFHGGNR